MSALLKRVVVLVGVAFLPLSVFAQNDLTNILGDTSSFLNLVITFLVLVATVVFLWGIVRYVTAGGDEEKIKEARQTIIWGIIFLAVMVAVWGFVNIVLDFIFQGETGDLLIPVGPQQ
ncbi:MAG: hypothetical protein G01um101429_608 [Parcubacteria group bacterium Gr01-1014_29]|nr:MAG: hypothetical protein G01um101429_608 [Parcubacteria group bacterium Gr01-1014_29]